MKSKFARRLHIQSCIIYIHQVALFHNLQMRMLWWLSWLYLYLLFLLFGKNIYLPSEPQLSLQFPNVILKLLSGEILFPNKTVFCGIKHFVHCGKYEINITYQTRADVCSGRMVLCGSRLSVVHSFTLSPFLYVMDSS